MKRVIRTGLAFAAGGLALLALDALARRRGAGAGTVTRKLLAVMRPTPVPDDTIETRVRTKLARTASMPGAITVSIEHGCVDLRGSVLTNERARIVKAIATVPGVDSVLDLMTEPVAASRPTATPEAGTWRGRSHTARSWLFRRAEWPRAARVLAAGSGLGIAVAGLAIGGLFAVPAAGIGLLLIARAASATTRRLPAAQREPFEPSSTPALMAARKLERPAARREPHAPF